MSDETATTAAEDNSISLQEVRGGAEGAIKEILNNFQKAIEGVKEPENKSALNKALVAATEELLPKKTEAFSSTANDAAKTHVDAAAIAEQARLKSENNKTNSTNLPPLQDMLSGSNKGPALAQLEKLAAQAGIKEVGGKPLQAATTQAQIHSNTMRSVDSLKQQGIPDRLYPPDGQQLSNGLGASSKAAFVMTCAERVQKGEKQAVMDMATPPVKASKEMMEAANQTGAKLNAGNTVDAKSVNKFTLQASNADANSSLVNLTRRTASTALTSNLAIQLGTASPSNSTPSQTIIDQINAVGHGKMDPAKEAEEAFRKEEERLMKEAIKARRSSQQAANKLAAEMGLIPALTLSPKAPAATNNGAFVA